MKKWFIGASSILFLNIPTMAHAEWAAHRTFIANKTSTVLTVNATTYFGEKISGVCQKIRAVETSKTNTVEYKLYLKTYSDADKDIPTGEPFEAIIEV